MNTITAEKLKSLIESGEDIILINVLGPDSFRKCHIKSSRNIPIHEREAFLNEIQNLDQNKKIILYCANYSCPASRNAYSALETLESFDTSNVFAYEGGIEEWVEKKYPVEGDGC